MFIDYQMKYLDEPDRKFIDFRGEFDSWEAFFTFHHRMQQEGRVIERAREVMPS